MANAVDGPCFMVCQVGSGSVAAVMILPLLQPCRSESTKPDLPDQWGWEPALGDSPVPGPSQEEWKPSAALQEAVAG